MIYKFKLNCNRNNQSSIEFAVEDGRLSVNSIDNKKRTNIYISRDDLEDVIKALQLIQDKDILVPF